MTTAYSYDLRKRVLFSRRYITMGKKAYLKV